MPLEKAQLLINKWNKIDRDEKHTLEYRLDIPEENPEVIIKEPMKFKYCFRQKIRGYGSRGSVPQIYNFVFYDFDAMEIPIDDEGMDAEHALYYVNKKNQQTSEWKYWLKIED
jgi:hypothetical protein